MKCVVYKCTLRYNTYHSSWGGGTILGSVKDSTTGGSVKVSGGSVKLSGGAELNTPIMLNIIRVIVTPTNNDIIIYKYRTYIIYIIRVSIFCIPGID